MIIIVIIMVIYMYMEFGMGAAKPHYTPIKQFLNLSLCLSLSFAPLAISTARPFGIFYHIHLDAALLLPAYHISSSFLSSHTHTNAYKHTNTPTLTPHLFIIHTQAHIPNSIRMSVVYTNNRIVDDKFSTNCYHHCVACECVYE